MKYIVILGDGMADYPLDELGGKTPLEIARKPYMDKIASMGKIGLVKTVPDNLSPGSDVANLSVLGYDPNIYYTGRSPLEAASIGVDLSQGDASFRVNLVSLSDEDKYSEKTMLDYSSDEITTKEAQIIISDINEKLGNEYLKFYSGVSYRHLLVWHGCDTGYELTPPHDISGKKISNYLPGSPVLTELMVQSHEILKTHPVNRDRYERGLKMANSIWIWGQGSKPNLPSFYEKYKVKGCVISAVDLVKGIGICASLDSISVEGATGNINTNYDAKAKAALSALCDSDFVYVHIEAPDECGHRFETANKVKAIELIDDKIVRPIFETLTSQNIDFSILVMPDHPTPLSLGTHTKDPVPFALYRTGDNNSGSTYCEKNAKGGLFIEEGHKLLDYIFRRMI